MRRASTLMNASGLAIERVIDSKYDVVKAVGEKLDVIENVNNTDWEQLLNELESAQDFTGITVVEGTDADWDPIGKVLTVPRGEQGIQGEQGLQGPIGLKGDKGDRGAEGAKGAKGDLGAEGPRGHTGPKGDKGDKGDKGEDLTVTQIVYNGNGTFTWLFSDGTNYTTPSLEGPKGDEGDQGPRGKQGTGVHHLKPTSTTDSEGDFGTFGELDTYTFYADPHEKLPLGHFIVRQGITPEMTEGLGLMKQSLYDKNRNGIVDNSEALSGKTLEEIEEERDLLLDLKYDKTGGMIDGSVTISGDLIVSGSTVTVDSETLLVKDNTLVLNNGEVGAGVTKGEAGIEVDRGSLANYKFVFSESDESFKIGEDGSLQKVATREDTPLDTGVAVWSSVDNTFTTTRDISIDTITTSGLVNGRDVGVDGTKLDTIQTGAQVNTVDSVAGKTGVIILDKADVGLNNADNTADVDKNVLSATKLTTPRTVSLSGDVEGTVLFDGSSNATINTTIEQLDASVIATGVIDAARLPSYVDDVLEFADLGSFPVAGEVGKIYIALDTNKAYRWSGSTYVYITSGAVDSVAGKTGVVTLDKADVGLSNVDNTSDLAKPISTATQTALDLKADTAALENLNMFRADKVLASKNIARLIYESGNLTKIRYNIDSDVDYEVLTYSEEDLVNVAHYINEELKGNTVLTYASDELVSSVFIGV